MKTHQVDIPPLRQRNEDIPLLLEHFLQQAAVELGKTKPTIPKELPVLLSNYAFPGNVRELRALAYDAMSLHRSRMLSMDVFRRVLDQDIPAPQPEANTEHMLFNPQRPLPTLQEIGDLLVSEAMQRAEGNQSLASKLLGISQPALSKRLKKNS